MISSKNELAYMTRNQTTPVAEADADAREESWAQTTCFALSAVALSFALNISQGFLNAGALLWISVAFAWCLGAVLTRRNGFFTDRSDWSRALLHGVLQLGVWMQLIRLSRNIPIYLQKPILSSTVDVLHFGALLVLLLTFAAYIPRFRYRKAIFPAILLVHVALGVWMIRHCQWPGTDVFVIQRDAARALLHGINPYTITFPDPYHSKSTFYAPGLSVGGRLMTGYVYPPLSILMALPGQLLGDVRYANLMAISGAGALLAYARPSRFSFLAATLFLFFPQVFFVLVLCWTDAFIVLLLAAVLFAACRAPRFLAVALGLLMAVKQYLFLIAPLIFLLVPEQKTEANRKSSTWRLLGKTVLVGLAVSLPLVLWNPAAYWRCAVLLNFGNPFRPDSLNFAAAWFAFTKQVPSSLIGFALLIPTYWLIVKRSPRTPAGFAGATALLYFVFFLFGRQAFINYYFVIFSALCGAVAVAKLDDAPNRHSLGENSAGASPSDAGSAGDSASEVLPTMQSKYS